MIIVQPELTGARHEPLAGTASPSTALKVKRATWTLDASWSPYLQGQLVAALPTADDLTALDPRLGYGCRFTAKQTVNAVTQSQDIAAFLRRRSADHVAAEVTLDFAGAESIWQEFLTANDVTRSSSATDLVLVKTALDAVSNAWQGATGKVTWTPTVVASAGTFTVSAANALWPSKSSAWDYILGIEESNSRWVRADETGAVVIADAGWAADTSTHYLSDADRIISVSDSIDRDAEDWGNAAIIEYTGSSPSTIDSAAGYGPGPRKTLLFERSTKQAMGGAAATIAQRAYRRSRNLTITAIADLSCKPNQNWQVSYKASSWFGKVQNVTFRYPEGLMDMTLNIIEQ